MCCIIDVFHPILYLAVGHRTGIFVFYILISLCAKFTVFNCCYVPVIIVVFYSVFLLPKILIYSVPC